MLLINEYTSDFGQKRLPEQLNVDCGTKITYFFDFLAISLIKNGQPCQEMALVGKGAETGCAPYQ